MRKNMTEIVFILDRSGSMSGLETDTIGGFNSMIEKQKKENGEALISISAKLMNHPLTKLCEKLFDEHRLMDFHRCVLDVDYRKLLLNGLAHN